MRTGKRVCGPYTKYMLQEIVYLLFANGISSSSKFCRLLSDCGVREERRPLPHKSSPRPHQFGLRMALDISLFSIQVLNCIQFCPFSQKGVRFATLMIDDVMKNGMTDACNLPNGMHNCVPFFHGCGSTPLYGGCKHFCQDLQYLN